MSEQSVDILLVGSGVMSATLGTMLARLDPSLTLLMAERLDRVAGESSDGWNNAGTGHAGYCELNYTSQSPDGSIAIDRALAINAAFETSLQFWAGLVEQQILPAPANFINPTPHLSLVWGEKDVEFLRHRHTKLNAHHLFEDMRYSEDAGQLREWLPLAMQQRDASQPIAATRVDYGTDIDFGSLTRNLVGALEKHTNFDLLLNHEVISLKQQKNGRWKIGLQDSKTGTSKTIDAGFVFLGAGGGALPLLQKSGIAESRGYGGFPVSGQWLVCNRQDVVQKHNAKVYGKAPLGAPPMSVPHLDTRIIAGKPAMLFGPFAGFTTKFQKQGSYLDLLSSVRPNNLKSILGAGFHNLDLTRYLVGEVFQSHSDRVAALRNFYPQAREEDWTLAFAGKRVQIIKRCKGKGGKLEFGTEIVSAADGSLAALLGASPGASTSVQAMIDVIERCFKMRMAEPGWQEKMREMVPSYGQSLIENAELLRSVRQRTLATLGLNCA